GGGMISGAPASATPAAPGAPAPAVKPTAPPAGTTPPPGAAMLAAPANVIVSLPAEAKLQIDGVQAKSTAAVRSFVTPALTPGQNFYYTLTAEMVRDGKTLT